MANFVVARGGKVKFERKCIQVSVILFIDNYNWTEWTDDAEVWATRLDHFPAKYNPVYKVLEVDASGQSFSLS